MHDSTQHVGTTTDTSKLITLESEPLLMDGAAPESSAGGAAGTQPDPAKAGKQVVPPAPSAALLKAADTQVVPPQASAASSAEASIHSAIKESVRPVYEQLVATGAVEALHDLKADLGLNKSQWSEQDKANAPTKEPGQWDAPSAQDPAMPPRTAAQAQMDREMASMMREKLVDQVTPWVVGLVVLYVMGYLGKLLYGYVRWKSAKRNLRRVARAKRHAKRRAHDSSAASSRDVDTPHTRTPHATANPQESA